MARGTEAVLRDRTQLGAFDRIRAIKEGKGRRSAFLEDSASDGPDSPDPPTPREPAKRVDRTRSLSLSESDGKENARREMLDASASARESSARKISNASASISERAFVVAFRLATSARSRLFSALTPSSARTASPRSFTAS